MLVTTRKWIVAVATALSLGWIAITAQAAESTDSSRYFTEVFQPAPQAGWVGTSPSTPFAAQQVGYEAPCDGCGKKVDDCGCCINPVSCHRNSVFADLLFLRPGNSDVIYAVDQTDPDPTVASPTGQVGIAGIDHEPGFRVGYNWAMNDCASIVATYHWFEGDTFSTADRTGTNVLDLRVAHPSVATSGAGSVRATASHEIDYQMLDLDYRRLWCGDCDYAINYRAGIRYGHLEQNFQAQQAIFAAAGLTTVATDIDFDGFGIRLGVDGMRRSPTTGLFIYGNTSASFLGGEFKADYRQTNQFGGGGVIGNSMEDYRVVTILEAELGVGWESASGNWRFSGGYSTAGWFNTMMTGEYINGVRDGDLDDISGTLTFDGLVARTEYLW